MYDVVVIGSGPGGYIAAIRAAQLGLKTACVEKSPTLGGTCLNVGCIPSKVLLHDSEISKDLLQMMQRKDDVVSGFTKGIEFLFKKNKVEKIQGSATLKSATQVEVEGKVLETTYIILATGSTPVQLPFLPIDEKKILTSTGTLALKQVPKEFLIVGAGVIGVELGSVYNRLGSKVTLIESADYICPTFDKSLSKELQKLLEKQGMVFHLQCKVTKANGTTLQVQEGFQSFDITGDAVLVAVGRKPYVDGLGLDAIGVEKTAKGFVKINDSFQTNISNIFAIGDLVEGPMLAHKASEEAVAVAELIANQSPEVHYLCIPSVVYTHPEVAAVGLSEEEAKQRGIAYKVAQFPFLANSRAKCIDDTDGFVKLLADAKSQRIIGAHIIGANASELIALPTFAIQVKAKAGQLADMCFAHPTLSESIKEAALALFQKPLHM